MNLLLDASAIVSLFARQSWTEATLLFLASKNQRPVVSDFAAGETVAGLLRLERIAELSKSAVTAAIADFDHWRLEQSEAAECVSADIRLAAQLVRRVDLALRMPDAIHLATARRLAIPLFTFDRRMRDAALALDISLVGPSPDDPVGNEA